MTVAALVGYGAAPAGHLPAAVAADVGPCPGAIPVPAETLTAVAGQVAAPRLAGTTAPSDADSLTARRLLNTTNRYELSTEFATRFAMTGGVPPVSYTSSTGTGELLRNSAAAMGLAGATETGAHDPAVAGRSVGFTRAFAVDLVRGIACRHRAVASPGWGGGWQGALFAGQAGLAGWLAWPYLSLGTRYAVAAMVVSEADRLVATREPYYGAEDGTILSPGDTKAEENAWNTLSLSLASAMMPAHPRRSAWLNAFARYALSSYATLADTRSATIVNGAALSTWLGGWNVNADGTVINHNIIHPDYMATIGWNAAASLAFGLAGQPTPRAAFRNLDREYRALTGLRFGSPPYQAPGGTIYVPDSGQIYFPQGNDWGTDRVAHFYYLDVLAHGLGFDGNGGQLGTTFERLHAARLTALQGSADDGRSFLDPARQNSQLHAEQWSTEYLSRAWLQKWAAANSRVTVTDADLSGSPAAAPTLAAPPRDPLTDTPAPQGQAGVGTAPTSPAPDAAPMALTVTVPEGVLSTRSATDPAADLTALSDGGVPAGSADLTGYSAAMYRYADGKASLDVTATTAGQAPAAEITGLIDNAADGTSDYVAAAAPGGTVITRVSDGRFTCRLGAPARSGTAISARLPVDCQGAAAQVSLRLALVDDRSVEGTPAVTLDPGGTALSQPGARVVGPELAVPAVVSPADDQGRMFTPDGTAIRLDPWSAATGWGTPRRSEIPHIGGVGAATGPNGTSLVASVLSTGAVSVTSVDGAGVIRGTWAFGGETSDVPAIAVSGTTTVVLVRGTDGKLWLRRMVAGTLYGWVGLGGTLAAGPAVTVDGSTFAVFYPGTDGRVWTLSCTGGCTGATSLGGVVIGRPAAAARGGTMVIAARGVMGGLYVRERVAGTWGGWRGLDDPGTSWAALVFDGATVGHLVVRTATAMSWAARVSGQWRSFARIPPVASS